jgi:hypothetical protein
MKKTVIMATNPPEMCIEKPFPVVRYTIVIVWTSYG